MAKDTDNASLMEHLSHQPSNIHHVVSRSSVNPDNILANIGYQAQLTRGLNTFETFGITMSIMGLMSSIATTTSIGLTPGPAAFVWGWFIGGLFILSIGYAIGEMASSLPAASGPYLWTYYYAPMKLKSPLSFIVGYSNALALAGGACSITYGLSVQIFSAVYIGKDGDFEITNGKIYGLYVGLIILALCICSLPTKIISKFQSFSVFSNNFLIILFLISLPVGTGTSKSASFNNAKFIFTELNSDTDWTKGWAFFLFGIMPAAWTIGGLDSGVHMAEEVKNPVKAVPIGVLGSIGTCWLVGWVICIVICACVPQDYATVLASPSGQPIAQIYLDTMGKKWAIAFISLCAYCQFLMAVSIMTALSRACWSFARDEGLPFSKYIKKVHAPTKVPINACIFTAIICCLLGLLILIGTQAANALFSVAIIGGYTAYSIPSALKMTSGKKIFTPGPFYAGKIWSNVIITISIVFQLFIIILAMFPSGTNPDKEDMNYAVVINGGIWVLAFVYYLTYKHKTYQGPKSDLEESKDPNVLDAMLQSSHEDLIYPPNEKSSV